MYLIINTSTGEVETYDRHLDRDALNGLTAKGFKVVSNGIHIQNFQWKDEVSHGERGNWYGINRYTPPKL